MMLMEQAFIEERIPHRAPFLLLDRVRSLDAQGISAEKQIPADWPVFMGHYPHYPIVPGVLLCEAIFQAGALLIAEQLRQAGADAAPPTSTVNAIPVLTRIHGAKFKREVRPGEVIDIRAELVERLGPAWLLKGSVRVHGKLAVQVEFACAAKEA